MIRHFDAEEQAVVWARSLARRRGLGQVYLTDNRKSRRPLDPGAPAPS